MTDSPCEHCDCWTEDEHGHRHWTGGCCYCEVTEADASGRMVSHFWFKVPDEEA